MVNHDPTIIHIPHALFPRTAWSPRHWSPGWRMVCSCGAKGIVRQSEEEARIDRAFHNDSTIQVHS